MRRALPLLLLLAACGPNRAIGLGEETCHDQANCEPDPTTTTGIGDDDDDGGETSTSTTGADEGPDDGSGEGGSTQFVPTSDVDDVQMCDIWDQQTCPEGEKCTAYATMGSHWDANKCVPVMGNDEWRDPCLALGENPGFDGLDSCAKGLLCWDLNQDAQGYCVEFCQNSPNDPWCPDDALCAIPGNGVLNLCLPTCDPLAPQSDCPNPDNLCVSDPGGRGFVCVLNAAQGMGTYGTECQYVNSCNYGLFCASADAVPGCQGSQGCCSKFCNVEQPNTCSGMDEGQECIPWWEMGMAPDGYEHVGGCAIPE